MDFFWCRTADLLVGGVGINLAAIHAVRSTRTALPSGRLGATTTLLGYLIIPPWNMHRGQVSGYLCEICTGGPAGAPGTGHCRGGLTPRPKANESPWVVALGTDGRAGPVMPTSCQPHELNRGFSDWCDSDWRAVTVSHRCGWTHTNGWRDRDRAVGRQGHDSDWHD